MEIEESEVWLTDSTALAEMESDHGDEDLSSRGWDAGSLIGEAAGLSGSVEDELNKSLTRVGCLDVDKDLELKQELIDDKEFDIPQVDTPPTLESILNETDDEDETFIPEDPALLSIETIDTHSCDTSSLASSDSGDRAHKRKKRLPDAFSRHGSVMRQTLLKGISAQIVSATDKVDAGLPTAIAVSNLIAVGTSHGLALIFGKLYKPLRQLQPLQMPSFRFHLGFEIPSKWAKELRRDILDRAPPVQLAELAIQISHAGEYLVSVSLDVASCAAQASSNAVTIRRTVWLKAWQADLCSKKSRTCLPFQG
ncbi:unnamed protein product [Ranitomeya imitator]|uniref:Uncharacterized protein n=1 Tax=Ranitomeya imitator TaxID=111125 RepID=A0ABN9L3W1_9NEOB|nr:unnamed protein product [Ranitomeya imitator]